VFLMKAMLDRLFREFEHVCALKGVHGLDRQSYLKWPRYFLDFCEKYDHPPRARENLMSFL